MPLRNLLLEFRFILLRWKYTSKLIRNKCRFKSLWKISFWAILLGCDPPGAQEKYCRCWFPSVLDFPSFFLLMKQLLITSSCFILRSLRPNNLIWNNFTPFHASQKYQFCLLTIWHHDLDFVLVIITACLRPAPPHVTCPRLTERRKRLKFMFPLCIKIS